MKCIFTVVAGSQFSPKPRLDSQFIYQQTLRSNTKWSIAEEPNVCLFYLKSLTKKNNNKKKKKAGENLQARTQPPRRSKCSAGPGPVPPPPLVGCCRRPEAKANARAHGPQPPPPRSGTGPGARFPAPGWEREGRKAARRRGIRTPWRFSGCIRRFVTVSVSAISSSVSSNSSMSRQPACSRSLSPSDAIVRPGRRAGAAPRPKL